MGQEFFVWRKQKVVLNNHESEWSDVVSGVPQGSILGPIIVELVDDMKIFKTTVTVNDFSKI